MNDEDAGLAVRFARREVINELQDHLTRREEGGEAGALNSEHHSETAAPVGGAERVGAGAKAARGPASDMPLAQEVIEHIDSGDGDTNDDEEMPGLARVEDSEDEEEGPSILPTRSRGPLSGPPPPTSLPPQNPYLSLAFGLWYVVCGVWEQQQASPLIQGLCKGSRESPHPLCRAGVRRLAGERLPDKVR